MTTFQKARQLLIVMSVLPLSACVSAPSQPDARTAAGDAGLDLLFATEFPVASKAEALSLAGEAWQAGDADRALFYYLKGLQFDPADAELLVLVGQIHAYRRMPELAVRAYSMALALEPDHAGGLEARGLLLLEHGEPERALPDLQRAVELDSRAWRARNGLGLLADRKGDHLSALEHYDAALSVVPEAGAVLNNRGYSRFLLGDYAAAAKDLSYAAHILGFRQAWMNLGLLAARQRDYAGAVKHYRQVLSEPEACTRVAEAAIEHGRFHVAQHLLDKAIRESPTYFPAAEENLAQLRLKRR